MTEALGWNQFKEYLTGPKEGKQGGSPRMRGAETARRDKQFMLRARAGLVGLLYESQASKSIGAEEMDSEEKAEFDKTVKSCSFFLQTLFRYKNGVTSTLEEDSPEARLGSLELAFMRLRTHAETETNAYDLAVDLTGHLQTLSSLTYIDTASKSSAKIQKLYDDVNNPKPSLPLDDLKDYDYGPLRDASVHEVFTKLTKELKSRAQRAGIDITNTEPVDQMNMTMALYDMADAYMEYRTRAKGIDDEEYAAWQATQEIGIRNSFETLSQIGENTAMALMKKLIGAIDRRLNEHFRDSQRR